MKVMFILLLALYLQADECIKCEEAIDDMIEAIEVNDRDKALELTDVIIKECNDLEAIELAKKNEMGARKMKKPKIIVYHNTILYKKVYIVVFINQPFDFDLDFDKAKEILHQYSSSMYIGIATGRNAITFIERKENFDRLLPNMEEFDIKKVMLMSIPDVDGSLYDVTFEDVMKEQKIEKAVMFEVKEEYMIALEILKRASGVPGISEMQLFISKDK